MSDGSQLPTETNLQDMMKQKDSEDLSPLVPVSEVMNHHIWRELTPSNETAAALILALWRTTGGLFHSGSFIVEDPEGEIYSFFQRCDVYARPSSHVLPGNMEQYGLEMPAIPFEAGGILTHKTTVLFCQCILKGQKMLFLKPEEYGMQGCSTVR